MGNLHYFKRTSFKEPPERKTGAVAGLIGNYPRRIRTFNYMGYKSVPYVYTSFVVKVVVSCGLVR